LIITINELIKRANISHINSVRIKDKKYDLWGLPVVFDIDEK